VVTGRHCRDLLMLRLSMLRVRMLVQSAGQNCNATLEICDPLVKPIESPHTIKLYDRTRDQDPTSMFQKLNIFGAG
jgi:hypothetical protein